ncbi:hypothetical protein H0H92_005630 [Tricholoma furcatifolium]|nr:hypothetical protein H0H92_005630 [Tricholoma furcatifolium]
MGSCFSRRKTYNPTKDIPDLTGRVILVTGGNTGIGYETVKHLARRGAKVYLGARNESKATGAIAKLQKEGLGPGNGEVVWLKADFSELQSAKEAAQLFLRLEGRLDVLINNAAQLTGQFEKTRDGISRIMTVNHFGPYIFTRELLPLLVKTSNEVNSDVRIVNVSNHIRNNMVSKFIVWLSALIAGTPFQEVKDFNEEFADDAWPDWARYCMTKLANVLWTRELQRRIDISGADIICMAINPGTVNTFASRTPFPFIASILFALFFEVPEVGAYTSCFATSSPVIRANPERYKGAFVEPVGIVTKPSEVARNDKLAEELWETTEIILTAAGI